MKIRTDFFLLIFLLIETNFNDHEKVLFNEFVPDRISARLNFRERAPTARQRQRTNKILKEKKIWRRKLFLFFLLTVFPKESSFDLFSDFLHVFSVSKQIVRSNVELFESNISQQSFLVNLTDRFGQTFDFHFGLKNSFSINDHRNRVRFYRAQQFGSRRHVVWTMQQSWTKLRSTFKTNFFLQSKSKRKFHRSFVKQLTFFLWNAPIFSLFIKQLFNFHQRRFARGSMTERRKVNEKGRLIFVSNIFSSPLRSFDLQTDEWRERTTYRKFTSIS